MKLRHAAAVRIQTRARGLSSREAVRKRKDEFQRASEATQRAYRGHKGRQVAKQRKEEKLLAEAEIASARAIQRIHRGKSDRAHVEKRRRQKKEDDTVQNGAIRIQSMFRQLV